MGFVRERRGFGGEGCKSMGAASGGENGLFSRDMELSCILDHTHGLMLWCRLGLGLWLGLGLGLGDWR